jgi:hypothetical protein
VGLEDVDVVGLESAQRLVHTVDDKVSREIEDGLVDPAALGGQEDALPPAVAQRLPQQDLGVQRPVVGAGVHEVDSGVDRVADPVDRVGFVERAVHAAQRRAAVAER